MLLGTSEAEIPAQFLDLCGYIKQTNSGQTRNQKEWPHHHVNVGALQLVHEPSNAAQEHKA